MNDKIIHKARTDVANIYKTLLFSRSSMIAWLCLLLGLFFSGIASYSLHQLNLASAKHEFNLHADEIIKDIEKRLQDHELILLSAASLKRVNEEVSRQQWRDFVQGLLLSERYPGIQGVGYAEIFPASQLADHEAAIRAEGFADYQVRPQGQRDIYSGIKYLEPFTGRNLAAFGYDMYSEPTRREAMQRAVAENATSISAKVTLVQETHGRQQAGFLMYVPIYRHNSLLDTAEQRWQAIKGFVYSPYRMDDLITGIFDTQQMRVDFQIFDGANAEPEALMYQSASAIDDTNTHLFVTQHTITKYGNNWTIKMVAQENFAAQFADQGRWLVLLLGLGISLTIFILMLVLTRRQEVAQHLANKMLLQYQNAKTHYEQQLTNVFAAASEIALIATDTQGTITLFNNGAERLLGYQAAELVGKTTPALFHLPQEVEARSQQLTEQLGEQISGFNVFVTVPMRQGAESREWHYVNKQGKHIPVALTVTVVRDEQQKITGFLGIAQDITERKRIEQMKNEFISTVSHELRTPLTSVSGALGLVLGGRLGPLSEKAEKILDTAYRNSKRLALLINDLLDIEKIAAGKLHFDMQNHAVSTLLEQAAEDNKAYGAARNINIELGRETDARVRVDEQRLKQVLANLLSNAIKFSPDGSTVTLAATADENQVTISVLDRGAGIPDDFKKSIFQKFAQANSSDTRQQGGTGLGLAISRQLVEQMHGAIDFESTEGKGSRFYFVLPRVKDNLPLSPAPASNSASSHAYRILIIEDDADVAQLLQIMLEDAGYQADIRYNGADALQALTTQHYDLLTLDLMLPDTSGLDIIRQLRADAKTANIPVVVVSAKMEQGRLEFNGEAHNIEWLAKPIAHQQLVKLVERQLLDQHNPKILHVEDDIDLHAVISAMVSEQMALDHAPTLASARKLLTEHTYGAVLLDIGLPDGSGWDLVPFIKAEQPHAAIIVLTGEDVNNDNYPKVEAVLTKTRLSAEQLITVIQQRIGSAVASG